MDLGFYMGIGGTLTYKNSKLPGVLKNIGLNHIVLGNRCALSAARSVSW